MHPLTTVATLTERLAAQAEQAPSMPARHKLVVVDCRHDLQDSEAGIRAYQEGHIPGAIHLHLDKDLSGFKTGKNGRHPLPDPTLLAERFAAAGIGKDSTVVAYDAQGGMFAARLWWLLRWLGHDAVQVLDGGWQAWLAAGNCSTKEIPQAQATTFTPQPHGEYVVSAEEVEANLTARAFLVIDARAPGRFAGEGETLDPVAGHIPGARNRFFQENLDATGHFKPAQALLSGWESVLGNHRASQTVQQCGSGVTACHNLLALEIAGMPGARLYPGSWSEWCADASRPVATGNN